MHNASEDTGHGKISTQQPLTGKVVSNAVFVGGLPNFYEDADLGRALEQFGRVTKASVQRDTQGVSRCFGIVSFEDQSSASRALSAQVEVQDGPRQRTVSVRPYTRKESRSREPEPPPNSTPKIFVGSLSDRATTSHLMTHFEKFGKIVDAYAIKYPDGRCKGFGFVTFDSPAGAENAIQQPIHIIDNTEVALRRAYDRKRSAQPNMERGNSSSHIHHQNNRTKIPRDEKRPLGDVDPCKIFAGSLNYERVNNNELGDYFSQFGKVVDAWVCRDAATQRSKGFGFVTFTSNEAVERVLSQQHTLFNRIVDVKRARAKVDEHQKFRSGPGSDRPESDFAHQSRHGSIGPIVQRVRSPQSSHELNWNRNRDRNRDQGRFRDNDRFRDNRNGDQNRNNNGYGNSHRDRSSDNRLGRDRDTRNNYNERDRRDRSRSRDRGDDRRANNGTHNTNNINSGRHNVHTINHKQHYQNRDRDVNRNDPRDRDNRSRNTDGQNQDPRRFQESRSNSKNIVDYSHTRPNNDIHKPYYYQSQFPQQQQQPNYPTHFPPSAPRHGVNMDNRRQQNAEESLYTNPPSNRRGFDPNSNWIQKPNTDVSMQERNDPYFTQDPLPGPDPRNQNTPASAATTSLSDLMTMVDDGDEDEQKDHSSRIEDEEAEACKGLPPGWVAHKSQTRNRIFYHNQSTDVTTWNRPM